MFEVFLGQPVAQIEKMSHLNWLTDPKEKIVPVNRYNYIDLSNRFLI